MDESPIKTGFTDLDEIIGGLYPGELMVIGSRPAICKTSFLATLIKKITWETGSKGLLFCLNKYIEQFHEYLVSQITGISKDRVRNVRWKLNKDELEFCKIVLADISDLPLTIYSTLDINPDDSYIKIDELCKIARELIHKKSAKIIYLDDIEFVKATNEASGDVYSKLKDLAKELSVPIVITNQVSRRAEPKLPNLSDLNCFKSLEYFDVVLLLDRKRRYDETSRYQFASINVAKNNYGNTREIKFLYSPTTLCYDNLPLPVKEIMECR